MFNTANFSTKFVQRMLIKDLWCQPRSWRRLFKVKWNKQSQSVCCYRWKCERYKRKREWKDGRINDCKNHSKTVKTVLNAQIKLRTYQRMHFKWPSNANDNTKKGEDNLRYYFECERNRRAVKEFFHFSTHTCECFGCSPVRAVQKYGSWEQALLCVIIASCIKYVEASCRIV